MTHARRKFADVVKIAKSNGSAHEAIKYFRALYKTESNARENNLSFANLKMIIANCCRSLSNFSNFACHETIKFEDANKCTFLSGYAFKEAQ